MYAIGDRVKIVKHDNIYVKFWIMMGKGDIATVWRIDDAKGGVMCRLDDPKTGDKMINLFAVYECIEPVPVMSLD